MVNMKEVWWQWHLKHAGCDKTSGMSHLDIEYLAFKAGYDTALVEKASEREKDARGQLADANIA